MLFSPDPGCAERQTRLARLRGDAGRFWHDPTDRRQAFEALIAAWRRGDEAALQATLGRIDNAVTTALRQLGLARRGVTAVRFDSYPRLWAGHKHPACALEINARRVEAALAAGMSDDLVRTWLHESVHGRLPRQSGWQREAIATPGFEEGLAEGMARLVCVAQPGLAARGGSFDRYVAAYEALAEALSLRVEDFWRALYVVPPGGVAAAFVAVAAGLVYEQTGASLPEARLRRLERFAPAAFGVGRGGGVVDYEQMRRGWQLRLGRDGRDEP
jgi:hypothetical protein